MVEIVVLMILTLVSRHLIQDPQHNNTDYWAQKEPVMTCNHSFSDWFDLNQKDRGYLIISFLRSRSCKIKSHYFKKNCVYRHSCEWHLKHNYQNKIKASWIRIQLEPFQYLSSKEQISLKNKWRHFRMCLLLFEFSQLQERNIVEILAVNKLKLLFCSWNFLFPNDL